MLAGLGMAGLVLAGLGVEPSPADENRVALDRRGEPGVALLVDPQISDGLLAGRVACRAGCWPGR